MSVFPEGSIERRLEAILTQHSAGVTVRQECRCGNAPGHLTLAEHQAEMAMAELGLTEFACGNDRWWSTRYFPAELE